MHKLIGYILLWITLVLMLVFDVQLIRTQELVVELCFSILFIVLYYIKPKTREVR